MMQYEETPEEDIAPDEEDDSLEMPKMGAFESMLAAQLPSPAELGDLLGNGPSFHDTLSGDNQPPQPLGGNALGGSGSESDYTGQSSYDPEAVKEDVRSLLSQKAQERQAASEEFQKRASEMMQKPQTGY